MIDPVNSIPSAAAAAALSHPLHGYTSCSRAARYRYTDVQYADADTDNDDDKPFLFTEC